MASKKAGQTSPDNREPMATTPRIELVSLDKLRPYENNARTHSPEQVDKLRASLREFGFVNPILIDSDYGIIAGHGRLMAAQAEGMADAPCVFVEHLTETQKRAYILADNKLAELAGWDMATVEAELAELLDADFNIDVTGFDRSDATDIPEVFEDGFDFAEYDEKPAIIKRGDLWTLGAHVLMCGDSTSDSDVSTLIGANKSKLLFTSPPYSDMRDYNGNKVLDVAHLKRFIGCYDHYCDVQSINLGIQRSNHEISRYWDEYIEYANSLGLKLLAWNVWDKLMAGSVGQQSAMIPIRHEWIFVFGREFVEINRTWQKKPGSIKPDNLQRAVRQADGSMKASSKGHTSGSFKKMESVVDVDVPQIASVTKELPELGDIRSEHPATFPVRLPAEYIAAFTSKGDAVVEPFGGSGTTLIACEQLGRRCFCMELDPTYCDVIVKRWEEMTGRKAVLACG